jgi:hypothetical protein
VICAPDVGTPRGKEEVVLKPEGSAPNVTIGVVAVPVAVAVTVNEKVVPEYTVKLALETVIANVGLGVGAGEEEPPPPPHDVIARTQINPKKNRPNRPAFFITG